MEALLAAFLFAATLSQAQEIQIPEQDKKPRLTDWGWAPQSKPKLRIRVQDPAPVIVNPKFKVIPSDQPLLQLRTGSIFDGRNAHADFLGLLKKRQPSLMPMTWTRKAVKDREKEEIVWKKFVKAGKNILSEDPELKSQGLIALGELQAREFAGSVAYYLNDPNPLVRYSAIISLRKLEAVNQAKFVARKLNDSSVFVRREA